MKKLTRRGLTSAQKTELWERWKKGESLSSIARFFGKPNSSIYGILSRKGGIYAPKRKRSRLALRLDEREEISRGIVAQQSIRAIAESINRSPSTISREINRNGGYDEYRATKADKKAWSNSLRPKQCKLANNLFLAELIRIKLEEYWSPEQIAGWLKILYPNNESNHVSHETIYKSLYVQARGVLKKELMAHLRSKRTIRRSQYSTMKRSGLGKINDGISISERPASIEDRAVPGHWEGDLIEGSKNTYIATLVVSAKATTPFKSITNHLSFLSL
jgi:IS30 family transposase